MGKAIFITGTDTGVGKTFFSCGLARWLRSMDYCVGVMKPAETGCEHRDGERIPEDAARLREAAGSNDPLEVICPYRLPEPLAPSIAAERAGIRIDVDRLLAVYHDITARHDVTLVEGAGGLLVPLLPSYTFADFARLLRLPVIVVAANKLGAINHLLLTLEHASCRGLSVAGYVLNRVSEESSAAADTNREVLTAMTGVPCLGELPFVDAAARDAKSLVERFEAEVEVRLLAPHLP